MKQIPLRKKRKEPRDKDWRMNEYSTEQIERWRSDGGNVGLRLDAGDLVIDVDPKHEDAKGRTARQLLDALEMEFGLDFSDDLIVQTGGDVPGYHVHLKKDGEVRTREHIKDAFGRAIEFKSVGRQVLAPGCIHPDGGTYKVIQGKARRDCPPVLLSAITRTPDESASGSGGTISSAALAEALAQLDPAEFSDYDEWRNLMFACHSGTDGSAKGMEVFRDWSTGDPEYADAGLDIEHLWESCGGEGRTIDTLYWHLSQRGLDVPGTDPKVEFADIIEDYKANPDTGYAPKWRRNPQGKIRSGLFHNVCEAIRALNYRFYLDEFSADIYNVETGEKFTDDHLTELGKLISEKFGTRWDADPNLTTRHEAIKSEARSNGRNPIHEYLQGLKWDGTKRMSTWLIDYARAEQSAYVQGVSHLFLLAGVARVMRPGIKYDMMLVLEGAQGVGKSSLVQKLGGKWALEGLPPLRSIADKDVVDSMRGYWIVEMEEMDVARKAKANVLKAFLSRQVDRVRLPYERSSRNFPRRCVFLGTTNDAEYLRDATGGRRFLPVNVGRINIDGLPTDQLWAEAYQSWMSDPVPVRLQLPERLWAVAAQEQESRRIIDPLEARFVDVVNKYTGQGFIPTLDLLIEAGLVTEEQQRRGQRLLGTVLRRKGLRKERRRVKGAVGDGPKYGWLMPKQEIEI